MSNTCPHCWTIPALDGSCCCDQPVQPPVTPPARRTRRLDLDVHGEPLRPDTPQPLPSRDDDTAGQLRDLPDLAAHLALRANTTTPGAEPGTGGDPAYRAPTSLLVMHLLDGRRHGRGDDVPRILEEERRHYAHPDREADDHGTVGLLPALCQWADMIASDLDGWEPGPDADPPTDDPTMIEVCDWIARHLTGWQAVNPEAALLLAAGVRRWHRELRAELGETDPPRLRHTNLGGCGGRLLLTADGVRHECIDCHEVLTPAEMLGLARWQAEVTLPEAASNLRIDPARLRKWKQRHPEQFPRPVNPGRHPALYRLTDIRELVRRRRGA